jgi:hypothetical protein
MKMRRSIGNARYSALLLLLLAAGAAACIKHSGVQFDITVLKVTPSNVAEEVGKKLEDTLGTTFDRNHDVEGVVRYSVKLPLGLNGGLHSIPFTKPCGQTFKERAEELWSNFAGGGDGGSCGGGGMGGGGTIGWGVVGYTPVYATATVSTPEGSHSEQVLVGFEAVYGNMFEEYASTDC